MTLPLRFLPEARDEFDAAVDWYEQQRPGLGVAFLDRVREVLMRIADNPRMHGTVYQDVRKAVVRKFSYVVLYREEADEVIVVSVFYRQRRIPEDALKPAGLDVAFQIAVVRCVSCQSGRQGVPNSLLVDGADELM